MAEFEGKQFGKYFLLEKLAVGGMAEIYKAKTYGAEGFEKLLAIKRILPHAAEDKEFIDMLIDEAKLSVLLSHANIVQVFDLGKAGQDYFISMEFIHGVNLRDILYHLREKNKKLPTELACYVASEVCKGLDYAHRKTDSNNQPLGIVHRDISPQNILISYEGEVKIVDFGIAKAAMNISHTMAGILKGKIAYMSPEQAMGKTVDARTDIFSLGILLYEGLTGKKLFTGESQFEVLKKIRTTRIDPEKLPPTIPAPLRTILAKGLAYNVEERYASAGDMQVALTKFLYATFTDFSPRKLASFVKELFTEELAKEKKAKEEQAIEGKTGSLSVATARVQETFVHRETTSEPGNVSGKSETVSEVIAAKTKPKPWFVAPMMAVLLTAGLGLATWKFFFAPKPAPVAVETGTLHVTSDPTGAAIFINGEKSGFKTPAILDNLELNRNYLIGLALEKFGRAEKTIRLANTEPESLNIELSQNTGILNVISDPPGVAILVNGIATGKSTPATLDDLELGTEYRITLSKPNYADFEQPVTLTDTTPQKISALLSPIETKVFGSVVLDSSPNGAKIFLDGLDTGKVTPAKLDNLEVGNSYNVRLVKEGLEILEKRIAMTSPGPLSITEKLAPIAKPIEEKKDYGPRTTDHGPEGKKPEKPKPKEAPKPIVQEKPTPPAPPVVSGGIGVVQINSRPSGANVFVNGESRGVTPLTLRVPAGSVKILVTKGEETMPCKETLRIRPGETAVMNCEMGTLFGKLTINSEPPRADVYLDGKKLDGKTPLVIKRVKRDSEHTLRLEVNGFKPWSRSFDLRNSESKSFNVELER